jgi:hypothetical protein
MISFKGALKAREPKPIQIETTKGGLVVWDVSEPNQGHPVDTSGWRRFDFIGIGKRNKGKTYRSYAADVEHAILDICTGHRLSEGDISLIK